MKTIAALPFGFDPKLTPAHSVSKVVNGGVPISILNLDFDSKISIRQVIEAAKHLETLQQYINGKNTARRKVSKG